MICGNVNEYIVVNEIYCIGIRGGKRDILIYLKNIVCS